MTKNEFLDASYKKFGPTKFKFYLPEKFCVKTYIDVECNIHGLFHIRIDSFLRSSTGCVACGRYLINISKDEFQKRLFKKFPQYKILSSFDRIPCDKKIKFFCEKCNSTFERTRAEILDKSRHCPTCMDNLRAERSYEKRNQLFENNKDEKQWTYLNKFVSYHTLMKAKCNKCNTIFEKRTDAFFKGSKCAVCEAERVDHELKEMLSNKFNNEYEYLNKIKNYSTNLKILHKACGTTFSVVCREHYYGERVCPKCYNRYSYGEYKILKYLESKSIKFTPQKKFDDFKTPKGYYYRYDFFLPDYKMLIEYDGAQHRQPITFGRMTLEEAYQDMLKIQATDKIKDDYAKANGYLMLRIPSNKYSLIEYILDDTLKKSN